MRVTLAVLAVLLVFAVLSVAAIKVGDAPSPTALWNAKTAYTSQFGDPVVDNGILFVVGENSDATSNTLYALDQATGSARWSRTFPAGGLYVAVGAGLVYHTTSLGLFALNQGTGATVWALNRTAGLLPVNPAASGGWTGKPTYAGGRVYATWYNTPMVALDAISGKVLYVSSFTVGSRIFASSDAAYLTFFTISDAGLYSLSRVKAADGTVQWSVPYAKSYASLVASDFGIATLSGPLASPMVQLVLGVRPSDGNFAWSMSAVDFTPANTNFDYNIAGRNVFTVYQNTANTSVLTARDVVTGAVRWSADVATTDNSVNLVAFDSIVVVVALTTGMSFAFDPETGAALWTSGAALPYYGVADTAANAYYFGWGNNFIQAVKIRN